MIGTWLIRPRLCWRPSPTLDPNAITRSRSTARSSRRCARRRACPTSARSGSVIRPIATCVELKSLKYYLLEYPQPRHLLRGRHQPDPRRPRRRRAAQADDGGRRLQRPRRHHDERHGVVYKGISERRRQFIAGLPIAKSGRFIRSRFRSRCPVPTQRSGIRPRAGASQPTLTSDRPMPQAHPAQSAMDTTNPSKSPSKTPSTCMRSPRVTSCPSSTRTWKPRTARVAAPRAPDPRTRHRRAARGCAAAALEHIRSSPLLGRARVLARRDRSCESCRRATAVVGLSRHGAGDRFDVSRGRCRAGSHGLARRHGRRHRPVITRDAPVERQAEHAPRFGQSTARRNPTPGSATPAADQPRRPTAAPRRSAAAGCGDTARPDWPRARPGPRTAAPRPWPASAWSPHRQRRRRDWRATRAAWPRGLRHHAPRAGPIRHRPRARRRRTHASDMPLNNPGHARPRLIEQLGQGEARTDAEVQRHVPRRGFHVHEHGRAGRDPSQLRAQFTVMVVVPVPPFVPRNVTVMCGNPVATAVPRGGSGKPAWISRQFTGGAARGQLQKRRPNAKFRGWLDWKIGSQEVGLTFSEQFLRGRAVAVWARGLLFPGRCRPRESQTNAHVTVVRQ